MLTDTLPPRTDFIAALYSKAAEGQLELFNYIKAALSCFSVKVSAYFQESNEPKIGKPIYGQRASNEWLSKHARNQHNRIPAESALQAKLEQIASQIYRDGQQILLPVQVDRKRFYLSLAFSQVCQAKALAESGFILSVASHIQRAVRIACKLAQQKQSVSLHQQVMDQLTIPAIAVNQRYRVVQRNALARQLLDKSLKSQFPAIMPLFAMHDMAHDSGLQRGIDQAFRGKTNYQRIKNDTESESESLLVIQAVELGAVCSDYLGEKFVSDPQVWLYFISINFSCSLKHNPLFLKLGLTHKESQLVEALFSGLALKEVANKRQVSRDTLRKQLSAVFRKTGCDSQEGLMLMLYQRCIYPMLMQPLMHRQSV